VLHGTRVSRTRSILWFLSFLGQGAHIWKFGGEQRLFFNNFSQPNPPTGFFHFATSVTEQVVGVGNSDQGNSFAGLLLGYGDTDSFYAINPSVPTSPRHGLLFPGRLEGELQLTVNLGLRYEVEHAV